MALPPVTTPLSGWVPNPEDPAEPPPAILADWIDPQTGDFASLLQSLDPIDAAVAFAFEVERDSGAAVQGVGHRFRSIRYVGPETPDLVASVAREAVSALVDEGLVDLEATRVETSGADVAAEIDFVNRVTGRAMTQEIR